MALITCPPFFEVFYSALRPPCRLQAQKLHQGKLHNCNERNSCAIQAVLNNMENFLIALRILSPVVALASGIMGIIGQSTDAKGNFTLYGRITLSILLVSTLTAIVITLIERLREREKEIAELASMNKSIEAQNRILGDIFRTFYRIETIDFLIEYIIPANQNILLAYKRKLDTIIGNLVLEEKYNGIIKLDESTSIITHLVDGKRRVYCLNMNPESKFQPNKSSDSLDGWAHHILGTHSDIMIGEESNFALLESGMLNPNIPALYLSSLCDLRIFAVSKLKKKESAKQSQAKFKVNLSYYPENQEFKVSSRNLNAYITHNNGKILSFTDIIGKQLTVFIQSWTTGVFGNIKLGEVRVDFNRSKAKDYSSCVHITGEQMREIRGKEWQAFVYKVKGGFSV